METIYAFIYRAEQKAEELWCYLARRRKKRRPLRSRSARDIIKDRVSIHDRPSDVALRAEADHWEGDLIICKRAMSVVNAATRKAPPEGSWLHKMLGKKPRMIVAIALANRMARRLWAMLMKKEDYRDPFIAAA